MLRWFPLWSLLVLILGTISGQNCWRYYRLSHRGVSIQGIAGERRPHGQIAYSFRSNGSVYQGVGVASVSDVSAGDHVPVVYLPEEPSINCLGNPGEHYASELPVVLVVSFLFPTLIIARLAYRFKWKDRSAGNGKQLLRSSYAFDRSSRNRR